MHADIPQDEYEIMAMAKGPRLVSNPTGLILALVLASSQAAAAEVAPKGASPAAGSDISDSLGDQAVEANPSIGAIESRIRALDAEVQQSGAWMDPTLSAEYGSMPIDAPVPGQHAMSGIQFTLRQTLYWPGKIQARKQEARSHVREAELGLDEQKVQLRALVRRAYYRLALTRQLRAVTREHIRLVNDFIDVLRIKNEAGVAAQHELLRLRVLVGQLGDDLKDFDQDEQSLAASINATLHRPMDVAVPTPERTRVPEPPASAQALARRAEQERPLLKRFSATADAYRAASRRAAREGYPDITLWAGYRVRTRAGADPGTDFVSLGVSLPIPLFYDQRWGNERRKNEQLAQAAIGDRAAEIDRIRGELGRVMATWKRAAQKARTYREELTPEARLALEATFASYQANRADFTSLFQAQVQLLGFERETLMAENDAAEARVDAKALVGSGVK
ncbi:MAG: TolC family protein [Polyangiaceae bacterium]|nr:TolC family protein [Polyangiaceae bacterium]